MNQNWIYIILTLILLSLKTQAQTPILTISNTSEQKHVSFKVLDLEIRVFGNIALTKVTMSFQNNSNRELEAELTFPLPEGATITGYALDIQGKLRNAVPVTKEKATEVFESIQHQKVDPGILEQVEGSNFRTRIYPLLPNKQRTIQISYEQILPYNKEAYTQYHLPLDYKEAISEFNIELYTYQNTDFPNILETPDPTLKFSKNKEHYYAKLNKNNFTPSKSLTIDLPNSTNNQNILTQQKDNDNYYFIINELIKSNYITKKWEDKLGIIWDNSFSGKQRDINKEFELLDKIIGEKKNLTIELALLNIEFKKAASFEIKDGDWKELKEFLINITYDGATDYSKIKNDVLNSSEYLLFSNGISTFGENEFFLNHPTHTIVSQITADFNNLKKISQETKGTYINLNNTSTQDAFNRLNTKRIQFLGIKENGNFFDIYPSIPANIDSHISITGISGSSQYNQITLLFGYDGKVSIQKSIPIHYQESNINIGRIWAQQKIAELDVNYSKNQEEIEKIGQQFGIVTRNTSLMVLENIDDYIKYNILPPDELLAEYTSRHKANLVAPEIRKENLLEDAVTNTEILKKWWYGDSSKKTEKKKKHKKKKHKKNNNHILKLERNPAKPFQVTGQITSAEDNLGLPGASVLIKDTNEGVVADFDGNYAINIKDPESTLVYEFMGYKTIEKKIHNREKQTINIFLQEETELIEELVINTGYQRVSPNRFSGSVSRIEQEDLIVSGAPDISRMIEGKAAGIEISNIVTSQHNDDFSTTSDGTTKIIMREILEDSEYLQAIDTSKTPYKTYLKLRKKYIGTPKFYFDIADFFYRKGDTNTAVLILSTLAELEIENTELYKTVAYKLKEYKQYEAELFITKKIVEWRPMDIQSHRDYALALLDNNRPQEALETLYNTLKADYSIETHRRDRGIEEVIITEINNILSLNPRKTTKKTIDKKIRLDFPVDIRVVINWNKNDTDIDLWVTDPNGERCYYSHKETKIGGRISSDITLGYGPEQFLLKKAIPGNYKIETDFFGENQFTITGPTTIMAEIFLYYSSGRQERKIITFQDDNSSENNNILIGEFEFK